MVDAWGYPPAAPEVEEGNVTLVVPAEMAEAITSMLDNPEVYEAAMQPSTTGVMLLEVESGTWLDPHRIIAVKSAGEYANVFIEGGGYFPVAMSCEALFAKIAEKLSEAHDRLSGLNEGAPPA